MQLNDYVPLAVRTESKIDHVVFDVVQLHQLMTMSIRVTELMDLIKKNIYYGKEINAVKWREKLIDIKIASNAMAMMNINSLPIPILDLNTRLFHCAIGIFTEAGEMFSALHDPAFLNARGKVDVINFKEELGDVEWYQAIAYDALGVSAEDNLQNNIEKLTARYPNKFESSRAINRDLETERDILEGKS